MTQAKEQLRLESDFVVDDDLIASYIEAARDQAEKYCNRSFALAEFRLLVEGFPGVAYPLTLPDPLTVTVDTISYIDRTGAEQILDPSDYTVDIARQQIRPVDSWPTGANSILIDYTAGPDGSASPPERPPRSVYQAMLLLITDMYEVRQSQVTGTIITQNPAAAMRLSLHRVEMGV